MRLKASEENTLKWSDLNEIEVLWAPKGKKKLIPTQSFIKRTLCKKD